MFKLAEKLGSDSGIYCGPEGLYLGPSALIERHGAAYRVRPRDEIAALLTAVYDPSPDLEILFPKLAGIAGDLQRGDIGQAMISAVLLGFNEIFDGDMERLARTEALLKYNFNAAESRDRQGRWARDEDDGVITPIRAGGPTVGGSNCVARAWESQPNAEFRNRLAAAEGNADKPNYGYGEVNEKAGALGRYQIVPVGLRAAGMIDAKGNWTGKYGIHSRAAFLADPDAQEKALTDYLQDTERQLKADGLFGFTGKSIDGLRARFTITRAGLIAAAHREGAGAVYNYLDRITKNGSTSKGIALTRQERAVETRLRTFADTPYE